MMIGVINKDKLFLLISGYLMQHSDESILAFGIELICNFSSCIVQNNYMDIIITKNPENHLSGKRSLIECWNVFHKDSFFYFDATKCLHCYKLNALEFIANYNDIDNKYHRKAEKYYNNLNEYKCSFCKYFILHIIKSQCLSGSHSSFGICESVMITPKPFHDSKLIKNIATSDKYKCCECKQTMQIIERFHQFNDYSNNPGGIGWDIDITRHQDYCTDCQLNRLYHKEIMNSD
eukprot:256283_1